MSIGDIASAKAYLSTEFGDESSLYDHLIKSMRTVLHERPSNPKKAFAILTNQTQEQTKTTRQFDPNANGKVADLLSFKPKEERNVQDIGKLAYLLECVGQDTDKNEFKLLAASMERLSETKNLSSSRFWGKFEVSSQVSYYIVEAEVEDNQTEYNHAVYDALVQGTNQEIKSQMTLPVPVEVHDGPNKYIYFVTKKLYDDWILLPEVIPYHIASSRSQKLKLTGNLNAQVRGYPPFMGDETQLLRALIARINASSIIAPVNFYIFDEQEEDGKPAGIILNPEYQPEGAHEMSKLENWVHATSYLLPQGRSTWISAKNVKNVEEDDEKEDSNDTNDENDKSEIGPSLLSSIEQDEQLFDLPAWSARSYGVQPKSKTVILRNHRWPGALSLYQQGTFYNCYFGNGLKDFTQDTKMSIFVEEELPNKIEEADPDPVEEKAKLAIEQPEEQQNE